MDTFLMWLISPPRHIIDEEQRKNGRLIIAFTLSLVVAGCIILSIVIARDRGTIYDDSSVQFAIGAVIILAMVALWGRLRNPKIALYTILFVLSLLFVVFPVLPQPYPALVPFAVTPILIAGIFYPLRFVVILGLMINAYLYVRIQQIGPSNDEYWQLQSSWYWVFLGTVLVIVFIQHLRSLEELRRQKLETLNQKLQQSERTLEKRVIERTKELETASRITEEALAKALEADRIKSQFLANMSHELRTPLNAILNFTAFVAKGVMGPVNARQQETLQESIDSGKHLLSLINDILDITKIEAGLMDLFIQDVNINEIISKSESIARGLVKDSPVEIVSEISHDLPITYGDKRRLRQVLINLVSNAVKFTPDGQITIRAYHENSTVYISVSDTGIGIAPEDHSRVFESFKQAKHSLHESIGSGLGVPISKAFVELHSGHIRLESELGVGTTFFVELPVLTENEARAINDKLVGDSIGE